MSESTKERKTCSHCLSRPPFVSPSLNQKLQTLICEIIPQPKLRTHNEQSRSPVRQLTSWQAGKTEGLALGVDSRSNPKRKGFHYVFQTRSHRNECHVSAMRCGMPRRSANLREMRRRAAQRARRFRGTRHSRHPRCPQSPWRARRPQSSRCPKRPQSSQRPQSTGSVRTPSPRAAPSAPLSTQLVAAMKRTTVAAREWRAHQPRP